jgi:peroxiredoxin
MTPDRDTGGDRSGRGPEGRARREWEQLDREEELARESEIEPGDEHEDGKGSARAARPYSIVVGVVFLAALVFAGLNAISNEGAAVTGLALGEPFPRFAAPAATGTLDGDANIAPNDEGPGGDRRTPACQVPGPRQQVIRICDFFDRPIVMVAWFTRGCGACERQLDLVERVRSRFPGVHFIGLDIADSRKHAASVVRRNGWRFPMAVDPDGAVSGLYGVGVGPMTFFAYPGGIAMSTAIGELDERELVTRVQRLLRSAERRQLVP